MTRRPPAISLLLRVTRENLAWGHFDAAQDAAKVSGQRDDEDRSQLHRQVGCGQTLPGASPQPGAPQREQPDHSGGKAPE